MITINTLLAVAFFAFSLVSVAVTAKPAPKCTTYWKSGNLTTSGYKLRADDDPEVGLAFENYYLNSDRNVAWKLSEIKRKYITVEYQTCTPNYGQEPNGIPTNDPSIIYGRFYLPKEKKCLAVKNAFGPPPYYPGLADCPSAEDMATKKSIPFNFASHEIGGYVDIRWIGGTIPKQKAYQGGNAGKFCEGVYYVEAKCVYPGCSKLERGRPITSSSTNYRIQMSCRFTNEAHTKGIGSTTFLPAPIRAA